jgi:hypothetical protein
MLSPPLIGDQVIEMREPREQRLLAPSWMMEALHGDQFPLDGVMRLIQQGASRGHLRVCEDGIPAGLLVLKPDSSDASFQRAFMSISGLDLMKALYTQ